MPERPTGTVTFLFTDIEGSTRLLQQLGAEAYGAALDKHRRILRAAFEHHHGVEVDTQGDAFFVAFGDATAALNAAEEARSGLRNGPIRVRMGLHTGNPHAGSDGYVGEDVHLGARIAAAGHGGQVLLSKATLERVDEQVVDLGEHRLKDFAAPISIYQLGTERFPPLKTISNTNLPRPASSFVGREREVAQITALLSDSARLVTLTGPGGTGKTRLSIEAAAELVPEFKAGVFWVPIAALRDHNLVIGAIAQTLGAKDGLTDHIADREMLLVLDNLEQVVDAAPELAGLVEACPNLRLLVTSRERLRVRGENEYPVPPLAQPDAVELFCARSGLAADDAIAQLCHRLDDLPLALELAAARASVLSPAQILERLAKRLDVLKGGRDADPRQQTLRATIEWSHDLLTSEQKTLFARLAVFRGGCTLESAEQVADSDLDALQSLVDKSLLRHTGERFWMLETIREYAAERLEATGEADDLRRRHVTHFLTMAEEAEPQLRYDSREWLDRLELELDNVRAALDRLEVSGDMQRALQLAGAVWRLWFLRGHLREGRRRLERLLRADVRPTAARARALRGATVITFNIGDIPSARPWAEESLALNRELGDSWGTALSLHFLGGQFTEEGDPASAVPLLEESVETFRELGDDKYALMASSNLAWAVAELGDRDRARAQHAAILGRARELHDERMQAHSLFELATLCIDDGRLAEASSMLKESLGIFGGRKELLWIAIDLTLVATVLARRGKGRSAAQFLASAQVLRGDVGGNFDSLEARDEATLAAVRSQLDESAFTDAWERGRVLSVDEAVAQALAELDEVSRDAP